MPDQQTRRLAPAGGRDESFNLYMRHWNVCLVLLSGEAAGSEYRLDRPVVKVGRSLDNDIRIDDSSISKRHATFEFEDGAFRVVDHDSTNGTHLNQDPVRVAEMTHGDHLRMGEHAFRLVVEKRHDATPTIEIPNNH